MGSNPNKFGLRRLRRNEIFLTEEAVGFMGGEMGVGFETFKELFFKGFILIRKNANLFINLLMMMYSAEFPDLKEYDKSLEFFIERLSLNMNDEEVRRKIYKEIGESAIKIWRRFDNFMHARHMM